MTPGCTAEGDALRDQFATFQARGVDILGVSFDTPADNATFVREERSPGGILGGHYAIRLCSTSHLPHGPRLW
jgi:peroxiredoxin Q/BCP